MISDIEYNYIIGDFFVDEILFNISRFKIVNYIIIWITKNNYLEINRGRVNK